MNNSLIPLTAETEDLLEAVRSADILVGIPSFNNARTVGHVVRAVVPVATRAFRVRAAHRRRLDAERVRQIIAQRIHALAVRPHA